MENLESLRKIRAPRCKDLRADIRNAETRLGRLYLDLRFIQTELNRAASANRGARSDARIAAVFGVASNLIVVGRGVVALRNMLRAAKTNLTAFDLGASIAGIAGFGEFVRALDAARTSSEEFEKAYRRSEKVLDDLEFWNERLKSFKRRYQINECRLF